MPVVINSQIEASTYRSISFRIFSFSKTYFMSLKSYASNFSFGKQRSYDLDHKRLANFTSETYIIFLTNNIPINSFKK